MKVDEALFKKIEREGGDYAEGVILPDGTYELSMGSHLHTLIRLADLTEEQIWERIPKEDSALFWLIDYTGCVITDYNSTVGTAMTPAQKKTYEALVAHGIVADKYYDITSERSKAIQMYGKMVY